MGPSHDQANPHSTQARCRQPAPRARRCLLKDCEAWFTPVCPQARYCSGACRTAAARWRRWKAQQRYRLTAGGRACRRAQSRRRRQRLCDKPRTGDRTGRPSRAPTWVITQRKKIVLLRPTWLLCGVCADAPLAAAAILCAALSTGAGTRDRARASVAPTLGGAAAGSRAWSLSGAYCIGDPRSRSVDVTPGEERWPVTTGVVPVASLRTETPGATP